MSALVLRPVRLHWICGTAEPNPRDLCAHAGVDLRIHHVVFVGPGDGDFTVSSAAIYLLRSLTQSRLLGNDEQLFPCCGHAFFDLPGRDALMMGCGNGVDLSVTTRCEVTRIGAP